MGALAYYLSLPLLYGIACLPFPVLYALSDVLYLLVYRVVGYRRGVVRANLRNSFPEKSEADLRRIERQFYHWFCDLALETIKTLVISKEQLARRVGIAGEELLQRYAAAGRSVILVMGHWGNWELGGARCSGVAGFHLCIIYHPLSDRRFDRLMYRMRTRLGNGLYPMKDTMRCMLQDRGKLTATAFIADQTPPPEHAYWTTFLHQDTPVFQGTERIARKLGYPVIYTAVDRVGRGRYVVRFEELEADPAGTAPGEISERHTRRLEADIRQKPAFWLWTHRRWKHRRPDHPSGTFVDHVER